MLLLWRWSRATSTWSMYNLALFSVSRPPACRPCRTKTTRKHPHSMSTNDNVLRNGSRRTRNRGFSTVVPASYATYSTVQQNKKRKRITNKNILRHFEASILHIVQEAHGCFKLVLRPSTILSVRLRGKYRTHHDDGKKVTLRQGHEDQRAVQRSKDKGSGSKARKEEPQKLSVADIGVTLNCFVKCTATQQ